MGRKNRRVCRVERRPMPYRNCRKRLENIKMENEVSIKSEPISDENDFDEEVDVETFDIKEEKFTPEYDGDVDVKRRVSTPERQNRRKKKALTWSDIEEEADEDYGEDHKLAKLIERMREVEFEPLAQPTVFEEDLIKMDFDSDSENLEKIDLEIPLDMFPTKPFPLDLHCDYPDCAFEPKDPTLPFVISDNENLNYTPKRETSEDEKEKKPREKKMYRKRITDPKLLMWYANNVAASQKYSDCTEDIADEKKRKHLDLHIISILSAERNRDIKIKFDEQLWISTEQLPTVDEMFED